MKDPTKADLAAAVARLTEENAGLRDLLAVIAGARPTLPVKPEEMHRFYSAGSDRLLHVTVAAGEVARYAGAYVPDVTRGHARSLREYLAQPLRYEAEKPAPEDAEPVTPGDFPPLPGEDDPASPDAAEALAGSIASGTPLLVTDDDEDEPRYPAPGSYIPDQPGYVVGLCEHRVALSEWRAGFRCCERCVSGKSEPAASVTT
jgi:hypothetical protein